MPPTLTYPGIYVEEIPSGVRPIASVSTSNTAFVGFFRLGPMNQPVRITSYGDFERIFGGLDSRSEASYAIQQYYLNGGQIAFVVRVAGGTPQSAQLNLMTEGEAPSTALVISAANPGIWGNALQVAIGSAADERFNLVVREVQLVNGRSIIVANEIFRNLSMNSSDAQFVQAVINDQFAGSQLIHISSVNSEQRPEATSIEDVTVASIINDPTNASTDCSTNDTGIFRRLGCDPPMASDGTVPGSEELIAGMNRLDLIAPEIFNLLCLPAAANLDDENFQNTYSNATTYCEGKRAFLFIDIPESIDTQADMTAWMANTGDNLRHENTAVYFPRLAIPDLQNNGRLRNVPASGTLAGLYARTDTDRGVWKAPAGTEASLRNAQIVTSLTDLENGALNPFGVNVLRNFPIYGNVSWGGRTSVGADANPNEWKYIPVRRLALLIEQSLFQGLKWVVFEPNDEPLWGQIRLNVTDFMNTLFLQGAFQGSSPRQAYLVKCDQETTTPVDVNNGIVNIVVGFAPLKPAEFVILKLQQLAAQSAL